MRTGGFLITMTLHGSEFANALSAQDCSINEQAFRPCCARLDPGMLACVQPDFLSRLKTLGILVFGRIGLFDKSRKC
jgi:hypothetical protein